MQGGVGLALEAAGNRTGVIADGKLRAMADDSPKVEQLKAIQAKANNSPRVKQAIQLQEMADRHGQQQQSGMENKTGLPDHLKSGIESLSGYSMNDVKVHYDSSKPAQLRAHAFAQGTDIHIGPSQERHLPHEAWHVVQQKQGRVQPSIQHKGLNINDDEGLEREADLMGARAVSRSPLQRKAYPGLFIGAMSGASTIQRKGDKEPILGEYKGREVNKSGKISSDAANYQDAVATGMSIRSKPLPRGDLVIGKLKYGESVFIKATNKTDAWYYVVAFDGTAGWINKSFVATDMPDVNATLHHITEPNLTTILKKHYIDTNKWTLSTGNDYTTLVAAVAAANEGRTGIKFDPKKYWEYKESMDDFEWEWSLTGLAQEAKDKVKANFDPVMENFAIYQATDIYSGHNIWLPSTAYIKRLQDEGVVATRPDWMNTAISVGQAIAGFTAGIFEGFFGAIVDTLQGLWEIGKEIIKTIGDVLTGEIFNKIEALYHEFKNLSWDKVKQIVDSLLSAIVEGAQDFARNWSHPDMYKRWNFRGNIVGNILLEVVLAIFSGGAGNAVKWAGKLGKIAPKLAKLITKSIDKVNDVLPPKFKKSGRANKDRHDSSIDENKDSKAAEKQKALVMAKAITEAHDTKDSSIATLKVSLEAVKKKFKIVKGFEVNAKSQSGHYEVWMLASRHRVDDDYTPKQVQRGPSFLHTSIKNKWGETMNRQDMREIQLAVDRIKSRNPHYAQDGTDFLNSHTISPDSQRLNTGRAYTEWTVRTPGVGGRARRRIVVDKKTRQAYYTHDHYESFVEIDLSQWK